MNPDLPEFQFFQNMGCYTGGGRGVAVPDGGRGDEVGEDGVDAGNGLVAARVAAAGAVAADGVRGHSQQREQGQGDK